MSPSEAHQRQRRLGIPPGAVSGEQRLLGAVDVSPTKSDPSELAQWPPQLAPQVRAELLAGSERLLLCLVVRSTQPEDLSAVNPAAPVDAADGIGLRPPLHRLGPLLGDVVLREPLERTDELAVDDSCRERIELAGDRRHTDLFKQRQASADVAVQDQKPSFCHLSDGTRRRLTPRAHVDGTPSPQSGAALVAGQ